MAEYLFDELVDGSGALIFDDLTFTATLVFKSASDTLAFNAVEAPTEPFYQSIEDLYITLVENRSIKVSIVRPDTLAIGVTEQTSRVLQGTFLKYAADTLTIQSLENRSINHPFIFPSASDGLGLSIAEAVTLTKKVLLASSDTLAFSLTDAGNRTTQGAVGISSSDTLAIALTDTGLRVATISKYAADSLTYSLSDSSSLASIQDELSWEDDDVSWGGVTLGYGRKPPVFIQGRNFYQIEVGRGFDGEPIPFILERTGLTIIGRARDGSPRNDPTTIKLVRSIYPMLRGRPGDKVLVSVGAQEHPDEAIEWEGPYEFTIGENTFVDFLVSGRYIAVKFEGKTLDELQLLSYDLDLTVIGRN